MTGIDRNEEPHRHREWAESFGALLADIAAAIDAYGGAFLVQYTTVLVTAGRRPPS